MVGIVVPVYVATSDIEDVARQSLRAQAHRLPEWAQLIVVRNGGAPADRWDPTGPATLRVDLPINVGYTTAVNIGLDVARRVGADYYVVSSADVFPLGDAWLERMMGDGIVSALEWDSDTTCTHDLPCPFWGGMFGFPEALRRDVGGLPTKYTRIGDAAFACRAAMLGWPVERGPGSVEHRHAHAANNVADPGSTVMAQEKRMLAAEYGRDVCALLDEIDMMSPIQRVALMRTAR